MQKRWWIGATVVLLAAGWAWQRWGGRADAGAQEPAPWTLALEETYSGPLTDYRERWDHLAQPLDAGGFAPRAWPHVSRLVQPRSSMRLEAALRPDTSGRNRWLQLMLASAAEYYEQSTSNGGKLPRSRVAAAFGRLDISGERATLSVGQLSLNGQEQRVVSAGFAWTEALAAAPLKLELEGDRLTVTLGPHGLSTLADRVLPGSDESLRAALAGERMQLQSLRWERRPPDADEMSLAQADKYLAFGRPEQSLPILDELLARSSTARAQMRKAALLALLGRAQEAQGIYRELQAPDQDRFYGGYAALALAQLERESGRRPLELERDLASLSSRYQGHPALDQATLLRARLTGEALGVGAAYQQLALQVLVGRDPAAARDALAMLSEGPLAVEQDVMMEILQSASADADRLGQALDEALTLKQAALLARRGELAALLRTAQGARALNYATRESVYRELMEALESESPAKSNAVLSAAADDGPFLRDLLLMRGYPLARAAAKRPTRAAAEEAARALLQARMRLGGGAAKPRKDPGFYQALSGSASSYGQLAQVAPSFDEGALCLAFRSGSYWGCGLNIHPNTGELRTDGSADLSGARRLKARVLAPKGVEYSFLLSESGCGPSTAQSFAGEAGADGEQYMLPVQVGTGAWVSLDLSLDEAIPVLSWGNLEGNFTLDLQAIQKADLAIPGSQGDGTVCVKDLRFSGR